MIGLQPCARVAGLKGSEWTEVEGNRRRLEVWDGMRRHGDRRLIQDSGEDEDDEIAIVETPLM